MNSRERVKLLLNREIPDRMGLYESFWPETIKDYWIKQGYPEGENSSHYFDYDIVNCGGWFNTEPFMDRKDVVEETEEWQIIKDGRGATLKTWKNKSGTPEHISFEVTTPEVWKKYRESLLAINEERFGDFKAIKKNLSQVRKQGKFSVFGNSFVWELMRATIGDVNFLSALLLEPDWIRDFCQTYLNFFKKHYEILFRKVGLPDGFFIYEDFGYSKSLFCSPATLAELVMPYEKELVSFFKDYGLPVLLHSCGDIRRAIPLIIEAGFDCLQPMEVKAGCNVIEIAKTYGKKISYMGNINVVALNTNDPDKVKEEIVPKLKELKKMKIPYFFHSDHSIPPDIKLKTYKFALELLRENWYY